MNAYWRDGLTGGEPFSFDHVFRYPADQLSSPKEVQVGRGRTVAIIGAGIAGLSAAYELVQCGFNVSVFESQNRVGGRIWTHHFSGGQHAELGAMRIPGSHACTLHYVHHFNLRKRQFVNYNSAGFYSMRGQVGRLTDWRKVAINYELRTSELRPPLRLLEQHMELALARLSSDEKYQLFHARSPGIVEEYDSRTLRQHLEASNLSQEAIEYIGNASGLVMYERASFLETLIDYFGLHRVDQFELVDGMEALVKSFTGVIGDRVLLGTRVDAVHLVDSRAQIFTSSERGRESFFADFVLCTAPARRAMEIDWSPRISTKKAEALQRLYYASSAKTVVSTTRREWELNQGIVGGGSFTDSPIQQVWYPSDNAVPEGNSVYAGITGDDMEQSATSATASRWRARSTEVSAGPGALTASYTWETNARYMGSLSEEDRTELVLRELERLHPGLRDDVDDVKHITWDQVPGTGGGAFAYYAPGEHTRYLQPLCEAHPVDDPRVFFAGEHISVVHAWIQGAVQSALQAVLDIASRAVRAPDSGRS